MQIFKETGSAAVVDVDLAAMVSPIQPEGNWEPPIPGVVSLPTGTSFWTQPP